MKSQKRMSKLKLCLQFSIHIYVSYISQEMLDLTILEIVMIHYVLSAYLQFQVHSYIQSYVHVLKTHFYKKYVIAMWKYASYVILNKKLNYLNFIIIYQEFQFRATSNDKTPIRFGNINSKRYLETIIFQKLHKVSKE